MAASACALSEQRGSAAMLAGWSRYGHSQRQARTNDSEESTVTPPPDDHQQIASVLATVPLLAADTFDRSNGEGPPQPLSEMLFQRLLRHRIIFLGQQVDDDLANRICAELILLAAEDDKRDIHLYINSPGGSVYAGMAIYDVMQFVKNDVATYAMGMAASMGQFLLCAGAAGKRYAMPHAAILMHQPHGGIGGTATDIRIQAEQSLFLKRVLAERIAGHTGRPVEQIEEDSDRDRWFTAEEAKDYGIVDHVVRSATEVPTVGPMS
jgi:ATP-dependent Clp protease, protease subunit